MSQEWVGISFPLKTGPWHREGRSYFICLFFGHTAWHAGS